MSFDPHKIPVVFQIYLRRWIAGVQMENVNFQRSHSQCHACSLSRDNACMPETSHSLTTVMAVILIIKIMSTPRSCLPKGLAYVLTFNLYRWSVSRYYYVRFIAEETEAQGS